MLPKEWSLVAEENKSSEPPCHLGVSASTQHPAPEFSLQRKVQRKMLFKEVNCKDRKIPKGLSLKSNLNPLQWLSAASMAALLGLSRCFLLHWCELPLLSMAQTFGQNCAVPPPLNVELNGENSFLYHLCKGSVSFCWEDLQSALMDPKLAQPCNSFRILIALSLTDVPLEEKCSSVHSSCWT